MAKNKKESEMPNPESLLEEKVDAMMDPKLPDAALAKESESTVSSSALPPLDIFAGTQGAPEVSKKLLKDTDAPAELVSTETEPSPAEPTDEEPEPAPLDLDDPKIDAAVDDIVAHEDNSDIEAADEEAENLATRPKKIHHHPVFWTLIFIIAVVAIVVVVLLITGGDLNFPEGDRIQSWLSSIRK